MDLLLKSKKFRFWVDEIIFNEEQNGLFSAILIPDIDSTFYPPWLTRTVHFPAHFLTQEFYEHFRRNAAFPLDGILEQFVGSVMQGAYYEVPTKLFPDQVLPDVITNDNDIFQTRIQEASSPDEIYPIELLEATLGLQRLHENKIGTKRRNLYLYCFNVGQGDSLLIIFPNETVYIIDTNIYSKKNLCEYKNKVKSILQRHKLQEDKIKALVITHKHLDHIRGSSDFILDGTFKIENFLMNFDYEHNTKAVRNLIKSASSKIPYNININATGWYQEGDVHICINNPDSDTQNKSVCPDINDSSITLSIVYGENTLFLTGDTGSHFLRTKLNCPYSSNNGDNLLKISHHGSCTGTDNTLLGLISPKYAFISAGNHKKFKHPHDPVIKLLKAKIVHKKIKISKKVNKTVLYAVSPRRIKDFLV